MSGEAAGRAAGGSSSASGETGTARSVWGALAREALNLWAIGLAESKHQWVDRAAQRWASERRRLGAQLVRACLALMLIWTALMLGLASVLLVVDPLWWPLVLAGASAACVLGALGLLWWARREATGDSVPRAVPP